LLRRGIDSCCLLLACCEQAQHTQHVNVFLHTCSSYVTLLRSSRMLRANSAAFICAESCAFRHVGLHRWLTISPMALLIKFAPGITTAVRNVSVSYGWHRTGASILPNRYIL
jgi:hypothetical protein